MAAELDLRERLAKGLKAAMGTTPRGRWRTHYALSLVGRRRPVVPIGARRRLALGRQGFLPVSHVLYDLDTEEPRDFLSDRERLETQRIDGRFADLLDDKLAFFLLLSRLGAPTPEVEAVLARGRIHPLAGGRDGRAWLRHRLAGGGRLVLKRVSGGGGSGILMLGSDEAGPVLNRERLGWDELWTRVEGLEDYIATTFVLQAPYAAAIAPGSTNTIRVLTIVDEDGAPGIATAVHRFGTARSWPVDNWTQGGLSVAIDLETGRLGRGAVFPRAGELEWETHHPETGAAIAGTIVPGWAEVRAGILALAERLPFLPYVGWDVIVTDGGFTVLEGNHYSDVNLLQVHGPLLREPRVRKFYRQQGVLA